MASQRSSVTHYEPFLPPRSAPLDEAAATQHGVTGASREAVGREMALLRDLNGGFAQPKQPPPQLRQPCLPHDHAQRVTALSQNIYERGVAVDRAKVLSLGRMRFARLLAAEREARTERVIGTRCDLTSFASVLFAMSQAGALRQLPVPVPTMTEQLCGQDTQLDGARKIDGFTDLWKLCGTEPRAIRAVYAFRDLFEACVFGESLYTWIEENGRVYHKFFCGASNDKTHLFRAWLPALTGAHYRATITDALPTLIFWLAGETSAPPQPHDLAREWFGVRLPTPAQITFARALLEGWLLGHKDWALWEHVGRATRTLPDKSLLERCTEQLRASYRKVVVFHQQLAASFFKRIGDHSEFEPVRHGQFLSATLGQLLNCISAVAAMCVTENSPANAAPVVARFRDWILCSGKAKPQLAERITSKLTAAFPGSAFTVAIEQ